MQRPVAETLKRIRGPTFKVSGKRAVIKHGRGAFSPPKDSIAAAVRQLSLST